MQYLSRFSLPTRMDEDDFILNFPPQLEMQCYGHNNIYPFGLFPPKQLSRLEFSPLTIFAGSNGSGKSTLLNLIAQKLGLRRTAPFNATPFTEPYLARCRAETTNDRPIPPDSRIITSDDVFDYMLDLRAINAGISDRREKLFAEYADFTDPTKPTFQLGSLEDYEELKERNDARRSTKSAYTARRMRQTELKTASNGENAYFYFTQQMGAEQAWCRVVVGNKPQFPTATGAIFEFGFADSILQMWASFLKEIDGQDVAFGCFRPEETAISHALHTAALKSQKEKTIVELA